MASSESLKDQRSKHHINRLIKQAIGPWVIDVALPRSPGAPDAVLTFLDGTELAVELTQLYHKAPTRKGDKWERTIPRIAELQEEFCRLSAQRYTRLKADIRLKNPSLPDDLRNFAARLVEQCMFHQACDGSVELYDFCLGDPLLSRYIVEMRIVGRLSTQEEEVEDARRLADLQVVNLTETFELMDEGGLISGLQASVEAKQAKLQRYLETAPRVWLLLHDGMAPSSWPPTARQIRTVAEQMRELLSASGFERVFYNSTFDGPVRLFP